MSKNLSSQVLSYIVSPSQMKADQLMAAYDIWGTTAHVIMLYETKILTAEKAAKILKALQKLDEEIKKSNFSIDPQKGAQLTLEAKIIEKAGETAGLSAHTARSRNDQVMVTEMLYLREELLATILLLTAAIDQLLKLSKQHVKTVFPGYTHMQPAKPTTFAQWCLAYAASLLRVCKQLQSIYEQFNLSPLGVAESFGTSWSIDRKLTAELLGFSKVWEIPQDVISSRGFFQLAILDSFNQLTIVASKIATDLLLYSTFEYGLVSLGEQVSQRLHPITGSSIMAQKKNPDALELVRSSAPQITGIHQIVSGILTALPNGYNRDGREIKEYIALAIDKVNSTINVLGDVFFGLSVNKEHALNLVIKNYSLTTDLADYIAQKSKLPYRLVYKIVGQVVNEAMETGKLINSITPNEIEAAAKAFGAEIKISVQELQEVLNPQNALEKRKHIGGTNSVITMTSIKAKDAEINKMKTWVLSKQEKIKKAKSITEQIAQKIINNGHI
jgi:argininosuccinate lyase